MIDIVILLSVWLTGFFLCTLVTSLSSKPADDLDGLMCALWPITLPIGLVVLPILFLHSTTIRLSNWIKTTSHIRRRNE